MINTITGELKIFTKEVETAKGNRVIFNACVGATKQKDGKYLNYYMPVNFATALREEIAKVYKNESFDIVDIEAWIKAYKSKETGYAEPVLFINKCAVITDGEKEKKKSKQTVKPTKKDSLPF